MSIVEKIKSVIIKNMSLLEKFKSLLGENKPGNVTQNTCTF